MSNYIYFSLGLLLIVMLTMQAPHAADSYQINDTATVQIDEHDVCARITNNHASGSPIMVPTKTATEWSTFRSNRPSGVTTAACPVACSGDLIGGYCWYLSSAQQSCTTTCASHGGCNLAGTRDYAGSSGTLANCQSVISQLYTPTVGTNTTNSTNVVAAGCSVILIPTHQAPVPTGYRITSPATTCEAAITDSGAPGFRACACNN